VARERLEVLADAKVILFFGFVRKYKGLHTLLYAMPSILEAEPDVRLVVAGEFYEEEQTYRKEIEDLGITDRVTVYADYIADDKVAEVFSAADVVVQPYLSATQSGVAQVAFGFDRPVITTDVGGLAEIVTHGRTGLVVPPDSPELLANAVITFFAGNLGGAMSVAIANEKGRFGWNAVDDAIAELGGLNAMVSSVRN